MNTYAAKTDALDLYGNKSSPQHYNTLSEPLNANSSSSTSSSTHKLNQNTKRTKVQRMVKGALDKDQHRAVCSCGSFPIPSEEVQVIKGANNRASFHGLQTCRSTFFCPVCEQRNAYKKAVNLSKLLQGTHNCGGDAVQVVLTIHHRRGQELSDLQVKLKSAFDAVFAPSKKGRHLIQQFGYVGYYLSKEITFSLKHGWHPHFHVTLFFSRTLNSTDIFNLEAFIKKEFPAAVARRKLHASPDAINIRRVDLSDTKEIHNAALYATKPAAVGLKDGIVSANGNIDNTAHLSIWQVVEAMHRVKNAGNTLEFKQLYAAFKEYERTMKRKRAVSISKTLKSWLKDNAECVSSNAAKEQDANNSSNTDNDLGDVTMINSDSEVPVNDVDAILSSTPSPDDMSEPRVLLTISNAMWYAVPKASRMVSNQLGVRVDLKRSILAACQREDASLKKLIKISQQGREDSDITFAVQRLIKWFKDCELSRFKARQKTLKKRSRIGSVRSQVVRRHSAIT